MVNHNSKHDKLVDILQSQLFQTHDYDRMWLFWEYCKGDYVGEVDLLAMADGIYDMYEVKCSKHAKSLRKAQSQYDKFQLAFPKWKTNGFFYAGQEIERLESRHS